MAQCKGCGGNNQDHVDWCQTCQMVIPYLDGGQMPWIIQSRESGEEIRRKLGSPDCRPTRVWRAIRNLECVGTDWALSNEEHRNEYSAEGHIEQHPAWEIDNLDVELMDTGNIHDAEPRRLRKLQRGGVLPDGSHLSWANGSFYLDGYLCQIPYRGLRKMMNRKRGLGAVDWKALLLSIDAICRKIPAPWLLGHPRDNGNTWLHPVAAIRFNRGNMEAYRGGGFARAMGMRHLWRWARSGWMDGLIERNFRETEWMRRWNSIDEIRLNRHDGDRALVPSTLSIKQGRLQLRVRRPTGWRKLEIESNPLVWAKIVTWALSPTQHEDYRMLMYIQQWLFTDTHVQILTEENRKGMEGLRANIESNDDIELNQSGIEVTGSSGAVYRVHPGEGAHGSRMVVTGLGHALGEAGRRVNRMAQHGLANALCIVESPQLKQLCLPDALSSTILALKNDLISQEYIDTVKMYIRSVTPGGRNAVLNNRAEAAVRRFTDSFPRLWNVLLRRPLGDRLTLTAFDAGAPNMRFESCNTEFTTRGVVERRAVYRMLEASGWVRDLEEERERGQLRVYIRLGTGVQRLAAQVEEIAEILEPMTVMNDRVRLIANPLWTYFVRMNPGIGELLPGHDERLD